MAMLPRQGVPQSKKVQVQREAAGEAIVLPARRRSLFRLSSLPIMSSMPIILLTMMEPLTKMSAEPSQPVWKGMPFFP